MESLVIYVGRRVCNTKAIFQDNSPRKREKNRTLLSCCHKPYTFITWQVLLFHALDFIQAIYLFSSKKLHSYGVYAVIAVTCVSNIFFVDANYKVYEDTLSMHQFRTYFSIFDQIIKDRKYIHLSLFYYWSLFTIFYFLVLLHNYQ